MKIKILTIQIFLVTKINNQLMNRGFLKNKNKSLNTLVWEFQIHLYLEKEQINIYQVSKFSKEMRKMFKCVLMMSFLTNTRFIFMICAEN